ncbi:hypothetical protein QNH48_17355 [Neobacillus sp. YX16]|uniref:hypothetical protein n=1 Tax=Neobacillus sp. YX16 TaxID=3047874 RepID=UPI0024C325EE|nr:hypothetical protein [Neobacillus sp. YX16]WHZ00812.1 hypothetical protein QNH48_17355 [Neobacillus sp. YX16]
MNQIQTITEENLKDFITCPYKFYFEFIEKRKKSINWRQVAQHVVNKVVYSFYQLPAEHRHSGKVLRLIDEYWSKVSPQIFESRIQYYLVIAKITDYLMENITAESKRTPPLFLFEKLNTYIEELEVDLSLTFDVAEWSDSSFVIKKYLVDASPEMLTLYYHLSIVFSEKVLKRTPKRVEVVTLLDGMKHVFTPTKEDLQEGLNYLQVMKYSIEDSSNYFKTNNVNECNICPFLEECDHEAREFTQKKYLS